VMYSSSGLYESRKRAGVVVDTGMIHERLKHCKPRASRL
jgi:hypothetical protein